MSRYVSWDSRRSLPKQIFRVIFGDSAGNVADKLLGQIDGWLGIAALNGDI